LIGKRTVKDVLQRCVKDVMSLNTEVCATVLTTRQHKVAQASQAAEKLLAQISQKKATRTNALCAIGGG
jgi:3-dehydroquinate synthetase